MKTETILLISTGVLTLITFANVYVNELKLKEMKRLEARAKDLHEDSKDVHKLSKETMINLYLHLEQIAVMEEDYETAASCRRKLKALVDEEI